MRPLQKGDISEDGSVRIVDVDRLCYLVESRSRGAKGLRTISKELLKEYIDYWSNHPNSTPNEARTALSGQSDIDKFEYGYTSTLSVMAGMYLKGSLCNQSHSSQPLQVIYYGAPGSGKSYKVKKDRLKGMPEENIFRTTFHPDSDYASFVGCYKPTVRAKDDTNLSKEELLKCFETLRSETASYPVEKFSARYHASLQNISKPEKKWLREESQNTAGISFDPYAQMNTGIAIGEYLAEQGLLHSDETITYDFSPQVFTNAYVRAWKVHSESDLESKPDPVYLIIEEINRGNCAQIFGDLFQLLDRDDAGVSEYKIKADEDLARYLQSKLGVMHEGIKGGNLCLPSNLHIIATMNTSDQSLFPIDSAFKRRWEWEYVPIRNAQRGWVIEAAGKTWDWWTFLEQINSKIGSVTDSEDKKLGYFFVKPQDNQTISADTFVSKVIFYLWNDVFKDYGFSDKEFQTAEGVQMTFPMFYETEVQGQRVNEKLVAQFLDNVIKGDDTVEEADSQA